MISSIINTTPQELIATPKRLTPKYESKIPVISAAAPEIGEAYFEKYKARLKEAGLKVESGIFGADMKISLLNDGPVTILLDSKKLF